MNVKNFFKYQHTNSQQHITLICANALFNDCESFYLTSNLKYTRCEDYGIYNVVGGLVSMFSIECFYDEQGYETEMVAIKQKVIRLV